MTESVKTKKRILVDLEICYGCKSRKNKLCGASCSYFYSSRGPHEMISSRMDKLELPPSNNGVEKLLAKAQQYLVCRRCEEAFCVNSCTNKALEKDSNGILQRHLFKCTSCKNCSIGCPFGTIYPEILSYRSSMCDYCIDRSDEATPPLCVSTCSDKALGFTVIDENDKGILIINEHLAVRAPYWNRAK